MKKYFMAGTDDEVKFGDMLELDFTKEMKNGNIKHHHMEIKFIPELVDMLLENEIVEERGEEKVKEYEFKATFNKNPLVDFDDDEEEEDLEDRVEELEDRVTELEEIIAELKG